MTYRIKYYISIGIFAAATVYMLYVQGKVFGGVNGWVIFEMLLSFAILIVAIFVFIYYRAHRNNPNVTQEQLLTAATKPHDDTPSVSKP